MTLPNRSVRIDPAHNGILNAMLGLLRAGRAAEVKEVLAALEESPDSRPVGPFRNAQAAQDFLVGRMVAATHPQALWLFGSRARGDARPDSDYDILVIKESNEPPPRRDVPLYIALAGLPAEVEVMVYTPEEVEEWQAVPLAFVTTAVREGMVLYERKQ